MDFVHEVHEAPHKPESGSALISSANQWYILTYFTPCTLVDYGKPNEPFLQQQ
jgi:hypothetical protein